MCGRFTLTINPAEMQDAFPGVLFPAQFRPRYNIAPSQPVLVLANDQPQKADFFVWGLIPSWSKDPNIGSRMINARAETLSEKPSFRGSYKYKRCLIFSTGFYEWKTEPEVKTKTPYYIQISSGQPFAFAGLWDEWQSSDGSSIRSCTIITTEPNKLMSQLHNRMPVILPKNAYAQWLDSAARQPKELNHLLGQYPAEEMTAYPVSTLVNSPSNDRAELLLNHAG